MGPLHLHYSICTGELVYEVSAIGFSPRGTYYHLLAQSFLTLVLAGVQQPVADTQMHRGPDL